MEFMFDYLATIKKSFTFEITFLFFAESNYIGKELIALYKT